jgi:hypothetical protein
MKKDARLVPFRRRRMPPPCFRDRSPPGGDAHAAPFTRHRLNPRLCLWAFSGSGACVGQSAGTGLSRKAADDRARFQLSKVRIRKARPPTRLLWGPRIWWEAHPELAGRIPPRRHAEEAPWCRGPGRGVLRSRAADALPAALPQPAGGGKRGGFGTPHLPRNLRRPVRATAHQ